MRVDVDGVGIEYDVTGPDDGRPVVLLHGFPDSAALWRHQVEPLAAALHVAPRWQPETQPDFPVHSSLPRSPGSPFSKLMVRMGQSPLY